MQRYSSGSSFEAQIGYSRAVFDGTYLHISGTTGYDYQTMQIDDDVQQQVIQCLSNIDQVLAQFKLDASHIVRIQYILPRREDFAPCWPILRKYFAEGGPAATMIVAGLAEPEMKIEIEVTAKA